jgi:hypothetical protein
MCFQDGGFETEDNKREVLLSLTRFRSIEAVATRALLNACALCHMWKRHVPVSAQSTSTDSFGHSFSSGGRTMVMAAPP